MRIGIIGAGAAGLTASWLLSDHHDVILFEKLDRLGGHANTVEVELDGQRIPIDAGFEFFMDSMFPTFLKLLELLNVPLHRYALNAILYHTHRPSLTMLPPFNASGIIWSVLRPYQIFNLIQLQRALGRARKLMAERDTTITVQQYMDTLPGSREFKEQFLFPFLLAQWCVEPEEFRQFAAYNAFKYATMNMSGLRTPVGVEVVGGTQAYIRALAQASPRTQVRTSATISAITRANDGYVVQEIDGSTFEFDHLIIATPPWEACGLLAGVESAEAIRKELGRIESFKTVIAVHGDRRLMPADKKYWSVVNMRYDGRYCQNTVWKKWKSRQPVFRSWVTFDSQPPDPLYSMVEYQHIKINLAYYQAQKALQALPGQNQLWLAGLYMHDIDSHESALQSAIQIAKRLDPQSKNLQRITQA